MGENGIMMRERKKKRTWIRVCLIAEAVVLVMFAAIALILSNTERTMVERSAQEEMNRLSERLTGSEMWSNSADANRVLLIQWATIREIVSHNETFRDNYAIAMRYDDNSGENRMYESGPMAILMVAKREGTGAETWDLNDPNVSPERYTWDLWKYFSGEENQSILRRLTEKSKENGLTFYISKICGRWTENERIKLTQVTFRFVVRSINEAPEATLRTADHEDTDEVLWDGDNRDESSADGVEFYIAPQSEELSQMLSKPDLEFAESRYRTYRFGVNEKNDIRTDDELVAAYREEDDGSIFLDKETGTRDASVVFYAVFDISKIVRTRLRGKLLVTFAFLQAGAIIAVILIGEAQRRRKEQRQLRDTFVNAMAHELKTPAAVVRNTAEYLSTGAKPEKQGHYYEVLTRESDSMDTLLNRMLTYTEVLDGKVDLNPQATDLNKLTDDTLASYADLIAEKGMQVEFTKRSASKPNCDPNLMGMVIDNLISNAVRYGEPGSTIVVKTEEMAFSVWNKAEALTEAELERIWTPMFSTERKKKDSETGGMGLAISAVILDRHAAFYEARNEGDGLLFRFDFASAEKIEKSRKYAWLYLISTTLGMLCAAIYAFNYITRGNTLNLVVVFLWLTASVLWTVAYTAANRSKQRRKKKTKPAKA